jgi:polar amino acid transport system permease protein
MTDPLHVIALRLLGGLGVSLQLAVLVLLLGTAGGVVLATFSNFGGRLGRLFLLVILNLARGIPLLVWIFAIFFVLPHAGLRLSAFTTAAVALTLFASVTIAEIFRGGILAVPRSQTEAGLALGLSPLRVFVLVVLPQALRVVLPGMVSQFIFLVKASALISLLGVSEMMHVGREIIERTLQGFEVMALIWIFYTIVCLPLGIFGRWLERRLAAGGAGAPGDKNRGGPLHLAEPSLRG